MAVTVMPREETNNKRSKRNTRPTRSAKLRSRRLVRPAAGAVAAERASAGLGTQDLEPTDWLFGDSLRISGS